MIEPRNSDERAEMMRLKMLGWRSSSIESLIKTRRRNETLTFLSGMVCGMFFVAMLCMFSVQFFG